MPITCNLIKCVTSYMDNKHTTTIQLDSLSFHYSSVEPFFDLNLNCIEKDTQFRLLACYFLAETRLKYDGNLKKNIIYLKYEVFLLRFIAQMEIRYIIFLALAHEAPTHRVFYKFYRHFKSKIIRCLDGASNGYDANMSFILDYLTT